MHPSPTGKKIYRQDRRIPTPECLCIRALRHTPSEKKKLAENYFKCFVSAQPPAIISSSTIETCHKKLLEHKIIWALCAFCGNNLPLTNAILIFREI
jgi:hypothetical protein